MPTIEGCGQEKHNAELEELVSRIKQQEKEIEGLQARLDGVLSSIHKAYSNIFEVEKSPTRLE